MFQYVSVESRSELPCPINPVVQLVVDQVRPNTMRILAEVDNYVNNVKQDFFSAIFFINRYMLEACIAPYAKLFWQSGHIQPGSPNSGNKRRKTAVY